MQAFQLVHRGSVRENGHDSKPAAVDGNRGMLTQITYHCITVSASVALFLELHISQT